MIPEKPNVSSALLKLFNPNELQQPHESLGKTAFFKTGPSITSGPMSSSMILPLPYQEIDP